MNALFRATGISKQSFHQYHNRLLLRLQEEAYLCKVVELIREDHPTMGCRDMYYKIRPNSMGRDCFEEFCRVNNYMLTPKKSYKRTTDSRGVIRFDNLTEDLHLTGADQLWVSDITYFEVQGEFNYLTFVMDAYTRRILGYSASKRLVTEDTTLKALTMAIKQRGKSSLKGLIFHSDGGGQYYDKAFLALTNKYSITNSMCKYAWENPYAERINGVIKNNYLIHRLIDCYSTLVKEVDRSCKLYNHEKPHISLGRLTPVEFENTIFESGKQSEREQPALVNKIQRPKGNQPSGMKGDNHQTKKSLQNRKPNEVEPYLKTVNAI